MINSGTLADYEKKELSVIRKFSALISCKNLAYETEIKIIGGSYNQSSD